MRILTSSELVEYLARDIHDQAATIVDNLKRSKQTLAFAESLTGGLLADAIVSVPGASSVFRGSAVTYATETKAKVLGVPEPELNEFGAVHPLIAEDMARSAARLFEADIAFSATGVAGPEAQDDMPVGRVYLGLWSGGVARSYELSLAPCVHETNEQELGSASDIRSKIRHASVSVACGILFDHLSRDM